MLLRYQILEKLIPLCPDKIYPHFDCKVLFELSPELSKEMIISAIHALKTEGLVDFGYQNGNKFFSFSVSPVAQNFLYTQNEIKHLKQHEIWENRIYGFLLGVASTVTAALILS